MHRIKGIKPILRYYKKPPGQKNCCWICEGWAPQEFALNSPNTYKSGELFIHLDYNKQGTFIGQIDKKQPSCQREVMVPPGIREFFCSINKSHEHLSKNYGIRLNKATGQLMNYVKVEEKELIGENYEVKWSIQARTAPKRKCMKPKKEKWSFAKSVFIAWTPEDSILNDCFELDFSRSNIPRIITNPGDLECSRKILHAFYKQILKGYKYYSANNPIQDTWCIQSLNFLEFVNDCELLDRYLTTPDVEIKFLAAKANQKDKFVRNPERGLIRHQFLEVLVRLAGEKLIKPKLMPTYADALEFILTKHCEHVFTKIDNDITLWREEQLWVESCDIVYKKYKAELERWYDRFSGKFTKPSDKKMMSLTEWHEFCMMISLELSERQINLAFNYALMTQVEEIRSEKIFQLNQSEWIEAIGRISQLYGTGNLANQLQQFISKGKEALDYQFEQVIENQNQEKSENEDQSEYEVYSEDHEIQQNMKPTQSYFQKYYSEYYEL